MDNIYRQGADSLSILGRLSTLQYVHCTNAGGWARVLLSMEMK